jgi:hypothetical protein
MNAMRLNAAMKLKGLTREQQWRPVVIVFIVQGNLEKNARDPSLNVF